MKKFTTIIGIFIFIIQFYSFGQGCTYAGQFSDSEPIKWDGINNQIINQLKITNPTGHCISLCNCSNITIQNCKLGPSKNEGVYLYNCSNITVINNSMDSIDSGVVADGCTGIKVINNDVKNVQGPMPRGQMVQFGNVYGTGNSISYNVVENIQGQSFPEDEISLYMSNGTPEDPIKVIGNWIRGGGPSTSGGGIMTGDMGGSYVLVKDNILVNPGQYGITISSGDHIVISNNMIFSEQKPYSNIGLSAYKQYDIVTNSNTIMNNEVNFKNKDGVLNCLWNAGNCGDITGWDTNMHNSNLNASILPDKIIGRAQGTVTDIVPPSLTNKFEIYPVPAFDHLTVDGTNDIHNVQLVIYDMKGIKQIEQSFNGYKTEINTGKLSGGIYILKILKENQLLEEKKIVIGKK